MALDLPSSITVYIRSVFQNPLFRMLLGSFSSIALC